MTKMRGLFRPGMIKAQGLVPVLVISASLFMLAASFAAVPLYRLFCATTGFGGTTLVAVSAPEHRGSRDIVVRFDANVSPGLPWTFTPETTQVKLRTGELATVYYRVTNRSDQPNAAIAMYNVSPSTAGGYFNKVACFCFNEQKLAAGESLELPVVFFLDPALEQDESLAEVQSVTLSYTFFATKGDQGS
jgi:cytochrome c oxidase assembly protein subunit 11